ncbi:MULTISPECIES: TIGR01244 family sulfur transferase [Methylobacterium]|uniref:Beta-lactamase hydrolase-like protein n=1 Tax=Methylobacterium thuringiense TaxID=1003091 RepID=A0ABQ4TIY8_9HYPH|nr:MULTISPECIES: TIGR01244 family sulfur transferase [Methylobacterium]TXN24998.1 TIGR01244 family phosphatase [Methylobacterium sp. WL9]GJE54789.1 Beta-lactamase hydrolase-like protein [Methylobacterium thuringiense]
MKLTPVHEKLSVAGQPDAAEIAALGSGGTVLLINNRPDDEEPGQPGTEAEQAAAEAAGLAYLHLPVTGPGLSRSDVDRFREAVLAAPGPVVAHCRSGTRSLTLWAIGEVLAGNLSRAELLDYGSEHGFDLTGAARWLDANGDPT